jgi:hypothetical protein
VLVCLWQQLDAMALQRSDDLCPHFATHMPVAPFLGNVQLATDFEAMHGAWRHSCGLGELDQRKLG